MAVCALIVNWNCRDETLSCLRALERSTLPLLPLVVDNGSVDGSVAAITAAFPAAIVLTVGYNSGFAAAVNLGLRHPAACAAEFVLVLNNDVDMAPDAVALLVDAARRHPAIGLLSATIFYKHQPEIIWSTGYHWSPLTFTTLGSERGRRSPATAGLRRVDFVELCAVLVRRTVFETLGLLDERFFVYYEDLDFCQRVRRAGIGLACLREAHAWHTVSASSEGQSPTKYYLMGRSSVQFFAKHTPNSLRPLVYYYRAYSTLVVLAGLLARGRPATAAAYLRGVAEGLHLARTATSAAASFGSAAPS